MIYRYNKLSVLLCVILINAALQPNAFALRPVSYSLSAVKSSSGGNLSDEIKNQSSGSIKASYGNKSKWAVDIAKAFYQNKRFDTTETYLRHVDRFVEIITTFDDGLTDIMSLEKRIEDLELELNSSKDYAEADYNRGDINNIINFLKNAAEVSSIPYRPPLKGGTRTIQNQMNMIIQMTETPAAMLLVFAHKLKVLTAYPELGKNQQDYIYREVMHIYAPLAERLGRHDWAELFRDTAFKVRKPEVYAKVKKAINRRLAMNRAQALAHLAKLKVKVKKSLKEYGISADIKARLKSVYSVYEKIRSMKEGNFEGDDESFIRNINGDIKEIEDLLGITMIFENEDDLWLAAHIPFSGRESTDQKGDIKADYEQDGYDIIAFHANVKDKDSGMLYEFQLISKDKYYDREYGAKAHWAYKLARETGQKFDEDLFYREEDFYQDFKALKGLLDKWVFVFKEIDDFGGRTAFKPLRFLKDSIPADFAASGSVDMLNEDYHKAVGIKARYDIIQDRTIRLREKQLNQTDKLTPGSTISILVKDNFLRKGSKAEQAIRRHAKMPRTHLILALLDMDSARADELADKGKEILGKEGILFNTRPLMRADKRSRLGKKIKAGLAEDAAKSVGLKNKRELYIFLAGANKDIVEKTKQTIREYSLKSRRDALRKGRHLLESGNNRLNLSDNKVLNNLKSMFDDESVRTELFNDSDIIGSLQEMFIAIGKGKINPELVKSKSSAAGKEIFIQKPDICDSAA